MRMEYGTTPVVLLGADLPQVKHERDDRETPVPQR
jgi:hypothetical protein